MNHKPAIELRKYLWLALFPLLIWTCTAQGAENPPLHGEELRHDDPPVRKYLDTNLPPEKKEPKPPTDAQLALLRDLYENGDPGEAERVTWILGDWPSDRNLATLELAAKSDVPGIKAQSATSIGMLSSVLKGQKRKKAVQILTTLLRDRHERVLWSALKALGDLKAESAVSNMATFTSAKKRRLAREAIRSLGRVGSADAFGPLKDMLDAREPILVLETIQAIGKLEDPAYADQLMPKLSSKRYAERAAAIRSITALGAKNKQPLIIPLLNDKNGVVRREALRALVTFGGAKHSDYYLARTKDSDHTVRRVAARAIGQFKIENGVPQLYRLLADEHLYVREDAVDSMVTIGNEEVKELAGKGLSHKVNTVREGSSQILGRLRSDRNIEGHLKLLEDKFLPARRWAAWAFGEIGRDDAKILEKLYACATPEDQDVETASCAVLSMGKLGYRKPIPWYQKIIPDKPTMSNPGTATPLRSAAVRALGMLKNEGSIGMLIRRFNDTGGMFPESPDLRFEAAVAFGRIGSRKAVGTLREHLTDGTETYRIRTITKWAIGKITGQEPDYELPPHKRPKPDYFVRQAKSERETEDAKEAEQE
ncbi:MAG: HEAT repeat domain-containing protein [Candidatus Brocadiia bacterium]